MAGQQRPAPGARSLGKQRFHLIEVRSVAGLDALTRHLDGDRGVLAYCGHDIHDLADYATFEEVCYLLWHRRLPTRAELGDLQSQLAAARALWSDGLAKLKLYLETGRVREIVFAAAKIALAERPGPVHIGLPVGMSGLPEADSKIPVPPRTASPRAMAPVSSTRAVMPPWPRIAARRCTPISSGTSRF